MKVGDLIKLGQGPISHFGLEFGIATLIEKLPRSDAYEYDWLVLTEGRFIKLGRQLEGSAEVISESR